MNGFWKFLLFVGMFIGVCWLAGKFLAWSTERLFKH